MVPTGSHEDQLAWDETIERLRAYIARRIRDPQAAEDIAQDVIARSLAAGALTRADNPVAWLYRSAANAVIDHYRVRRDHLPITESVETSDRLAAPGPVDAEDDGEATSELVRCVQPMVARLDPIYRDAVSQIDLDGRPQAVVAREAGVSLSGMKSRVQRGRRQLHELIVSCCHVDTDRLGSPIEVLPRSTCGGPTSCA